MTIDIDADVVLRWLDDLPERAISAGLDEAARYVVLVVRTYVPYRYVSVQQAGGWASERQRRYVMAAIRDGRIKIPYRRTRALYRAWRVDVTGTRERTVTNQTPYAGWVLGRVQSRGHQLRGWSTVDAITTDRADDIAYRFEVGVNRALGS